MNLKVSYVVVTDTFETIRDVVRHVAASSIARDVELVIVCPSRQHLQVDATATRGIGVVRVVGAGEIIPLSSARAAGIRAASCPLVFIGETHSFPALRCLEALLAAHLSGDYAGVMPVIENANPATALSWAALMLTYRHWIEPAVREETNLIPTYNGCFRRAELVAFGDRLTAMLDIGGGLDADLRAQGGRFLIEPAARLAHLNMARWRGLTADRFLSGRSSGAARARRWSLARRLSYVIAAPLLPFVIAGRTLRSKQWTHHRAQMPSGTLAALVVCATVSALGELTAFLSGGGQAHMAVAEYEIHRTRYS